MFFLSSLSRNFNFVKFEIYYFKTDIVQMYLSKFYDSINRSTISNNIIKIN